MRGVTIRHGPLALTLAPEWGGRVAALRHAALGDLLVPLDLAAPVDPDLWPKAGAFPLIPYHGRIEGARFTHRGAERRLRAHPHDPDGHTLHGPAQRRAWDVRAAEPDAVTLGCDYAADGDWPWRFAARQAFRLDDGGLALELAVTNTGPAPMPAGLGWHPYFPKAARIETDAARAWPRRTGTALPTGADATPGALGGDTQFLSRWRRCTLTLATGAGLVLEADGLGHLVVHDDPPGYTCVEPADHLANALNLALEAEDSCRDLAPGETRRARVRLRIAADAPSAGAAA